MLVPSYADFFLLLFFSFSRNIFISTIRGSNSFDPGTSVLIWVQTVCKGYMHQYSAKVANGMEIVKMAPLKEDFIVSCMYNVFWNTKIRIQYKLNVVIQTANVQTSLCIRTVSPDP